MSVEAAIADLTTRIDLLESNLDGRISTLERLLPPTPGLSAPPPVPPPPRSTDAVPPRRPAPGRPDRARQNRAFELEDVLRIVGVLLVGLAAVFLVSTAISRGWIGPELQLLGATLIGFGLLGGAVHLAAERRAWGTTFGIGGSAVVTICAGAAYAWLELVGPVPALVLVTAASAISVAVAIRIKSELVAIAATAAMLIVPPFASIIADGPVLATGIWLGLFAVAATVIGVSQHWLAYKLTAVWATAFWVIILAAVLAVDSNTDHLVAGAFLVCVVGAMAWLGPLLSERLVGATAIGGFGTTTGKTQLLALEHRGVAALPLWAWQSILLLGSYREPSTIAPLGLIMAGGFLVLAVGARSYRKWISEIGFLSHLLGAGLLVTVAALTWFDGPVLIVALAAQGAITLFLAYYFDDLLLKLNGIALALVAWLLVVIDLTDVIRAAIDRADGVTIGDHVARLVAVTLVATSAWLIGRHQRGEATEIAYGIAWITALLYPVSLLSPFIDDRLWLVVGSVIVLVSLAAAEKLGRAVLAIGIVSGVITVMAASVGMIETTAVGLDGDGVPLVDHLSHLAVVLMLGVVTAAVWTRQPPDLSQWLFVGTWISALGWLASVLVGVPQGQVAISAVWAFLACGAIVAGLSTGRSEIRYVGFATLGVVLVKLLTVDLAEVETLWRVGLFLVIGLGLLRLGYVLPKLAARYAPEESPSEETANTH